MSAKEKVVTRSDNRWPSVALSMLAPNQKVTAACRRKEEWVPSDA